MDPFTLVAEGLALVKEGLKIRGQLFASLSPETQTKLAEKWAEGEMRWLELGATIWEFFAKLKQEPK